MSIVDQVFEQQEIFNTKLLPELLPTQRGRYALVHGGELVGTFETADEAYSVSIDRFGIDAAVCIAQVEPLQHGPISVAWEFALL